MRGVHTTEEKNCIASSAISGPWSFVVGVGHGCGILPVSVGNWCVPIDELLSGSGWLSSAGGAEGLGRSSCSGWNSATFRLVFCLSRLNENAVLHTYMRDLTFVIGGGQG